ncbi:hypothetical protein AAG570_005200 [Ranatra chinensis]|uniref:D-aminoacyl-tRNA deacylase n=1 Tax=Ranatra chinensis TaxID=642074 RepID=A0ABD0YEM3_9HEMI
MRTVIQRVVSATASVNGEVISSIGRGLCILVGISREDTEKDIDYLVKKILNIRFFEDDSEKRWNKNIVEKDYEILCLSQITLYHKLKGNKLDFHQAMPPQSSKDFYHKFLQELRNQYKSERVKGKFMFLFIKIRKLRYNKFKINFRKSVVNLF